VKGLPNVGDVLGGKYKVERILGIGGMGMVVMATHLELDQVVAIKFMLPQAMESPEAAARFMREARAAGRLTNDHVCRVSDVGKFENGAPYIVMEYMEGQDLSTLIKRKGAQSVHDAVDFIVQASEGMAEAHGHGIVHRDLKPDNLFLATRADGSEIVKILDFGISKAAVTGIATKTGDIMGSPAYMAPEQMQSTKDVDQRADIWSLGVILYQLISGRLPFVADTLPALCLAVLNETPPSPESIRKEIPPGLAQVVMRCLAKARDDRYRNVHELAVALAPFGKPESMTAVTRIRSMLQRKRPPTPPPLMMLPSEFNDVTVAPTLVGDAMNDQSVPAATVPPRSADPTKTTMGGATGQSMSLLNQTKRPGVIGALLGAIALVGLIIVMVLIKRSNSEGAQAGSEPATPTPPPTMGPTKDPSVEINPPPPPDNGRVVVEPLDAAAPAPTDNVTVIESPPTVEGSGSARKRKPKDKDKDKKAGSAGSGSAAAAGSATPDEEDKWGHMQHDGEKKKEEPKKEEPKKEEPKPEDP
jgi:eukaryotic-like serine/threonine-protein kinase